MTESSMPPEFRPYISHISFRHFTIPGLESMSVPSRSKTTDGVGTIVAPDRFRLKFTAAQARLVLPYGMAKRDIQCFVD